MGRILLGALRASLQQGRVGARPRVWVRSPSRPWPRGAWPRTPNKKLSSAGKCISELFGPYRRGPGLPPSQAGDGWPGGGGG